jgi:hypothetical protein
MIVDILYELSILCITADGAIRVLGHEWSRACSKSWGKFLIVSVSLNCIEKVYPMHCVGNMQGYWALRLKLVWPLSASLYLPCYHNH